MKPRVNLSLGLDKTINFIMDRYFNKKYLFCYNNDSHRVSFAGGGTDYPELYKNLVVQ